MKRFLIIAAVLLGVALLILAALGPEKGSAPPSGDPPQRRYKSMMAPGGTVPLKVLVMREEGSDVHAQPNGPSKSTHVDTLTIWYPFEEKDGFTRIGKSPMKDETIGWIRSAEAAKWTTKEGIKPNDANRERPRFHLWSDRTLAGTSAPPTYAENPDYEIEQPYPVLAAADGQYQVAIMAQTSAGDDLRVTAAWSAKLRVPDDALFYYLTTREELNEDLTEITTSILEIQSGGSAGHPVLRVLKNYVDIAVARDIVNDSDDESWIRKVLTELRGPHSVAGLQEAELRRDAQKMKNRLDRMKRFYNTPGVWNERGQGWLPSELLPVN
jgi:hypothetical protein